jgi:hypothetical protein
LEWYCRPELLEEIQGDPYELFDKRKKDVGSEVAAGDLPGMFYALVASLPSSISIQTYHRCY